MVWTRGQKLTPPIESTPRGILRSTAQPEWLLWLLIFRMKWRRDASQSIETLKSNSVEDNGHEKAHVWNLGKPRKHKAFSCVEHSNFITSHVIKWNVVYLRLGLGFNSNEIAKPKQPKKKLSELSKGPRNSTHTYTIVSMSQTQITLESRVLSPLRWSCELGKVSKNSSLCEKKQSRDMGSVWELCMSCSGILTTRNLTPTSLTLVVLPVQHHFWNIVMQQSFKTGSISIATSNVNSGVAVTIT